MLIKKKKKFLNQDKDKIFLEQEKSICDWGKKRYGFRFEVCLFFPVFLPHSQNVPFSFKPLFT